MSTFSASQTARVMSELTTWVEMEYQRTADPLRITLRDNGDAQILGSLAFELGQIQ